MKPVVKSVILAGGQSSRMGRDKALLEIDGRPLFARHIQNLRLAGLDEIYISTKKDASYLAELARFQVTPLFDLSESIGPASALLSAFAASKAKISDDDNSLWFALACDFPLADENAFRFLLDEHSKSQLAPEITCFCHDDGTPEPLFAIWTTSALARLKTNVELGLRGPLATLKKSRFHELSAVNPEWLKNANTPEEWAEISAQSTTKLSSPKTRW